MEYVVVGLSSVGVPYQQILFVGTYQECRMFRDKTDIDCVIRRK